MGAKPEYRDRPSVEVAVLDALVDRPSEGMTVLELRAAVEVDIDRLETALSTLKADGLILVENGGNTVRIRPADHVVPTPGEEPTTDRSVFDALRDRLGF